MPPPLILRAETLTGNSPNSRNYRVRSRLRDDGLSRARKSHRYSGAELELFGEKVSTFFAFSSFFAPPLNLSILRARAATTIQIDISTSTQTNSKQVCKSARASERLAHFRFACARPRLRSRVVKRKRRKRGRRNSVARELAGGKLSLAS